MSIWAQIVIVIVIAALAGMVAGLLVGILIKLDRGTYPGAVAGGIMAGGFVFFGVIGAADQLHLLG